MQNEENRSLSPRGDFAALADIPLVKAALMLGIVFYHSLYFSRSPGASVCPYGVDWLSSFLNCSFVFLSGYIFAYVQTEKNGYPGFGSFLKKRAKRLLIPYIAVSLLWGIPWRLLLFGISLRDVGVQWALAVNPDQLWFLPMLFEVSAVFYFLQKRLHFEKRSLAPVFAFFCLSLGGNVLLDTVPNLFRIFNCMEMLLFYYLGFITRVKKVGRISLPLLLLAIAGNAAFLSLYELFAPRSGMIFSLLSRAFLLFARVCGVFGAVGFLSRLSGRVKGIFGKILSSLSRFAVSVYLFHQQWIYLVLHFTPGLSAPTRIFLSFVIACGLSLCMAGITQRYGITRFLTGEGALPAPSHEQEVKA